MKPHLLLVPVGPNQTFSVRHDVAPNFLNRWHYHAEVELVHIVKGTGTQFIGSSIHHFKPGDLILVGSNLPHYWKSDDIYCFHFHCHAIIINNSIGRCYLCWIGSGFPCIG